MGTRNLDAIVEVIIQRFDAGVVGFGKGSVGVQMEATGLAFTGNFGRIGDLHCELLGSHIKTGVLVN